MNRTAPILGLALVLGAATAARAQDFSGSWDVTGSDPSLGTYSGWATVTPSSGTYEVSRLVEVDRPLPDGRKLVLSWRGKGHLDNGGLAVEFELKRQDFVAESGSLVRGPADKVPLAVTGRLASAQALAPGAVAGGTRLDGKLANGPDESWVRVIRVPVPHPWTEVRRDAFPTPALVRSLYFLLFRQFHSVPWIAPYASRPEFKAAVHEQVVDTTGKVWTRANPGKLLVVQKVPDAIALLEEDMRASAFRWRLGEKAVGWDDQMIKDQVEASTGMIGGLHVVTRTRLVHGDSCLHQGTWVASQGWRYVATSDPAALANVELGTRAVIAMCDAPGDPKEFARAVQDASAAPPGWARSTVLPGIAYLPGGNNDMLHGVDLAFVIAERVLPPGHPLLAEVGARAKRLVENHKVAGGGTHELILSGVAARLTGDASIKKRYRKKVIWNVLERLWLVLGDGIPYMQEVSGRSGPHLATVTFTKMRLMGGSNPDVFERSWRSEGDTGLRRAFAAARTFRPGLLAAVAAAAGAPGADDLTRDVLAELPYPTMPGPARIDFSISPSFCVSPYPFLPWKFDFTTNKGRVQGLEGTPLWTIPDTDNYWKEGPTVPWQGSVSPIRWSRQDYLHAYWYGRAHGSVSAAD